MNAFLFERNLNESARCACGAEREDWKHALVVRNMYEDLRNLSEYRVCVFDDGSVNIGCVLECKEKYECSCKFDECVCEEKDE